MMTLQCFCVWRLKTEPPVVLILKSQRERKTKLRNTKQAGQATSGHQVGVAALVHDLARLDDNHRVHELEHSRVVGHKETGCASQYSWMIDVPKNIGTKYFQLPEDPMT